MTETILQIEGARKSFGSTTALDGADIALHRGERLALLGPNGAGKTTLMRSIAGRVRLDEGTIRLFGQSMTDASPGEAAAQRRRLGFVPQDIALYPLMTARENLRAFGELHGVSKTLIGKRVDEALNWIGLADRADDLVKKFSGGMKRRLNIACGVLHEPEVILLDEPTVGVDPQSRQRIWDMMDELCGRGASLLLTTHQLDEAEKVCDRVVIIDHGRVIADGTLEALIEETIGSHRRVILVLDGALADGAIDIEIEMKDDRVVCRVDDVAAELPPLLERIHAAGHTVMDVQIEAPTLHAVFIHLTGRELRE